MSCCGGSKSGDLGQNQSDKEIRDSVQDYYSKTLKSTDDLASDVCVNATPPPKHVRQALTLVHDEVVSRYYGCGLVIPYGLEGCSVLDLGSGSGRDCYIISKLVGEKGHVTGIDMTDAQLEVARKHIDYHTEKFGYEKSNVNFVKGYMEKLDEAGLKDNTFDIIISNCVVNLSPDKPMVLKEAYRVLKDGGEFYFSDVYADRRVPKEVREDEVLWGECISGALYWDDLVAIADQVGFTKPRLVDVTPINIANKKLEEAVGDIKFASVTYRLFKLPSEKCDATQAIYNGSITACPDSFVLDADNVFKTGDVVSVDSEVATILQTSRLEEDFSFDPSKKPKTGGCGDPPSTKENNADPFKFLAEGRGSKSSGGCCGSKSDSKGTGCC
ncbi:arsenite methyltransferase-like [Glandiceps talaboti]